MKNIFRPFFTALCFICFCITGAAAFDFTPQDTFGGPGKGQRAPDAALTTLEGGPASIFNFIGKRPMVIEFGSYTCPIFREKHARMESMFRDYKHKVFFMMIYTIEAHPKGDVCPYSSREWVTEENENEKIFHRQPAKRSERLKIAEEARSKLNIEMPLFLDTMVNSAWNAYGKAPNAAYLIGIDGKVKLRQGWFEPDEFRKALEEELR